MRAWLACCLAPWVDAAPESVKSVRVFVALCDNRTQGIQRVAERIGNGDDPEAVRAASGHAYARHQRISPAAGAGISARAAE